MDLERKVIKNAMPILSGLADRVTRVEYNDYSDINRADADLTIEVMDGLLEITVFTSGYILVNVKRNGHNFNIECLASAFSIYKNSITLGKYNDGCYMTLDLDKMQTINEPPKADVQTNDLTTETTKTEVENNATQ